MPAPPLHVVQITDPHLFASAEGELRGVNTARSLEAVIRAIHELDRHPDLIVLTGDLAQDESRGAYQRLQSMLASFDMPILSLPGNHDDPALIADFLDNDRMVYCRPLTIGDWLMLPLDTHVPGEVPGEVGTAQLASLRRTLADTPQPHAAVWLHHHPLPSGCAWLDTVGLRDAAALLAELDASDRVRAVLWGHVHQAAETGRNGVLYASAPSSARQFLPQSRTFALDERPPGWRSLTMHADGTVTTRRHWLNAAAAKRLVSSPDGVA